SAAALRQGRIGRDRGRVRPRGSRYLGRHHRGTQHSQRPAQERLLQHDGRAQSRPVTRCCPMLVEVVRLLLFPALMAFAAASDLLNMTISNRISLALVGGFAVLAVVCGLSPQTIAAHAAAGLLVLAIGFALFARGLVGGGDAKLAAAAA